MREANVVTFTAAIMALQENTAGQLEVHTNFINLFLQALKSTIDYCTVHNAKCNGLTSLGDVDTGHMHRVQCMP